MRPPPDDWRHILLLAAADEVGMLQALGAGATPARLAADLAVDERATRIVVECLVAFGYAAEGADGTVALTEHGADLVNPARGADPLAAVLLAARDMAAQTALAEVLRTGRPRHDMSAGDPSLRARFMRAMRDVSAPRVRVTCAALGPPAGRRLLDVGGAPGSYAVPFARAGWDVTVVDLEDTLALVEDELRREGITCVAGDMTRELPAGDWDCVYLGNVVHLFGPAAAEALVARAGAVVAPGGRLAVQEVIRGLADPAAAFGVTMLAGTEAGDAYTLPQLSGWMAAAGCPVRTRVAVEPRRHHLLVGDKL